MDDNKLIRITGSKVGSLKVTIPTKIAKSLMWQLGDYVLVQRVDDQIVLTKLSRD